MGRKIEIDETDLQQRDRKINSQALELKELKGVVEELRGRSDKKIQSEVVDTLGELNDPIDRKIDLAIKRATKGMESNFGNLAESINDLKQTMTGQSRNLMTSVAASTLGDNFHTVTGSQEFKDFLETKPRGVNIQWQDSWADAMKQNDLTTIRGIVESFMDSDKGQTFRAENSGTTSEGEAEETHDVNVEPNGSSDSNVSMKSRFLYKASDLSAKYDQFNRGEITDEQLSEYETGFNAAVDKGQVENDLPN